MSDVQRVVAGHGDVWGDVGGFLVRSGDSVDRAAAGYERGVLLVQPDAVVVCSGQGLILKVPPWIRRGDGRVADRDRCVTVPAAIGGQGIAAG